MYYQESGEWCSVPFAERDENIKMPVGALQKIKYSEWADVFKRADDKLRGQLRAKRA